MLYCCTSDCITRLHTVVVSGLRMPTVLRPSRRSSSFNRRSWRRAQWFDKYSSSSTNCAACSYVELKPLLILLYQLYHLEAPIFVRPCLTLSFFCRTFFSLDCFAPAVETDRPITFVLVLSSRVLILLCALRRCPCAFLSLLGCHSSALYIPCVSLPNLMFLLEARAHERKYSLLPRCRQAWVLLLLYCNRPLDDGLH